MDILYHSANNLPVAYRIADGYINATALCKAAGKKLGHYLENQQTKDFLTALSLQLNLEPIVNNPDIGIPASALVLVFKGGNSQQGTWVHPQVAVHLGMWLSPEFSVLVTKWVVDWMTNRVTPQRSQSSTEFTTEPKALPWTPPPLYPQMTEEQFNALPPSDQWLYLETEQERSERLRRERREINHHLNRCYFS